MLRSRESVVDIDLGSLEQYPQMTPSRTTSFWNELQRRHVYKVGAAYVVAGWLLVQVITQVFPIYDISSHAQRIFVGVIVAGFPVTLVLAWLFDVTPEGIIRTGALPAEGEAPAVMRERRSMDRKLNYVLGVLVLLGFAYFVAERTLPSEKAAGAAAREETGRGAIANDKSIAVLPLANSTGDTANEYFSDGISEELISALSRLGKLKVIGRTSAFQFKNRADDSKAIGEKLGVVWLLEGSVRKSDQRVRIAVELVRAADGASVWSETYDRELKDIFALQSDIAGAVAGRLRVTLLGAPAQIAPAVPAAPPDGHLAAYTALLQGRFYSDRFTLEDRRKASDFYRQAIQLEPRYALAHAALAFNEANTAEIFASNTKEKAAALANARSETDVALQLDSDLPLAHAARAYLLQNTDFDLAGASREMERLHELAPENPLYLPFAAYQHLLRGEYVEAIDLDQRAVALDPLDGGLRDELALIQLAAGRLDDAEATLHKMLELQAKTGKAHMWLALVAIQRGDSVAALQEAAAEPEAFWRTYALALAHFAHGDRAEADAQLAELTARYPDESAAQIAMVHGLRSEPDEMFQWLEHGIATRDPGVLQLYAIPFLLRYQQDPRFAMLCRRLGLPAPASAHSK